MTNTREKVWSWRHTNYWFGFSFNISNELWYVQSEPNYRDWIFFSIRSFGKLDHPARTYSIIILWLKFSFGRCHD